MNQAQRFTEVKKFNYAQASNYLYFLFVGDDCFRANCQHDTGFVAATDD